MTALDGRSARRRYLVLTALRWLPVGLLIPIFVVVPLSRGEPLLGRWQGIFLIELDGPRERTVRVAVLSA